jgi:hypothetical protein
MVGFREFVRSGNHDQERLSIYIQGNIIPFIFDFDREIWKNKHFAME